MFYSESSRERRVQIEMTFVVIHKMWGTTKTPSIIPGRILSMNTQTNGDAMCFEWCTKLWTSGSVTVCHVCHSLEFGYQFQFTSGVTWNWQPLVGFPTHLQLADSVRVKCPWKPLFVKLRIGTASRMIARCVYCSWRDHHLWHHVTKIVCEMLTASKVLHGIYMG